MEDTRIIEYLKRVTADLHRARTRLLELESKRQEPVAIVSAACRFPGGIDSPEDLWRAVVEERDLISAMPADRGWDIDELYDPDPDAVGHMYVKEGGFLQDAAGFDAGLFGIPPREALSMDPQQRLLLETTWETFERAGLDPRGLAGSRTGVFIGILSHDHGARLTPAPEGFEGMIGAGTAGSIASGRLSYVFGLEGPALTVDTACSSSLVALHLAVQSLRSGECDLAVAGGATVMSTVESFVEFSRQRGLAPNARIKAFDDEADGSSWSEGVGTLLVERLCDARRNGHPVLAVVRGTAVNQDGASNGLTAPNGRSQARLIRTALDNAQLTPADVDAVEAHGTGTRLGDPIEAQALLATYGQNRTTPLHLGSVKTNIGHTQAAAGIAGVIKMVLALRHGVLPRTLHVTRPTSHVDWSSGAIELLTRSRTWPQVARPRRAAVSAFGISGTNAHVILEQPEEPEEPQQPAAEDTPSDLPLLLSAASAEALAAAGKRLADHLEQTPGLPLPAVAHTLATTRALLPHRAAVLTDDHATALDGLRALADNRPAPHLITATATLAGPGPVFVFPGQGSQWAGMARTLHTDHPIFRQALDDCAAALDPLTGWSLTDTLTGSDHSWLHQVDKVQPALFAVMTSLARLWIAHGIQPGAVIGHSQGEIAAAHLAGILTLQDAARIVHTRSTAMRHLSGHGGMATINTSAEQLQHQLHGLDATIAAHNSPTTTVISGTPQALDELTTRCESDGLHLRRIHVDYASHSPQVDAYEDEITTALAGIRPRPATTPMISTVTGEPVQGPELDAAYWYANLRRPVLFHQALTHLTGSGHHTTIETSPHPVLTPAIQETADLTTLHTLRRDHGTTTDFTTALAAAHVTGTTPTWTTQLPTPTSRVPLPTYPFQRRSYWPKPVAQAGATGTTADLTPADPGEEEPARPSGATPSGGRVLDIVLNECARVLGHASAADVPPQATFKDLGFDSFAGTELCKHLSALLGRRVLVNSTYDHPSPAELAAFLEGERDTTATGVVHGGTAAAQDDEPIVIVGMACRFPGGVQGPEDLWRLLVEERDAIGDFPADRGWNTDELYDPDPANPGTSYVRQGGFLDDAAGFDASLFGIAPREALAMDPHQRLLLETAWEVFERAGISPASLRGSRTGVFVGTNEQDYATYTTSAPAQGSEGFLLTGHAASVASGRLSYVFGLEGPALTVDTACSSSLVALHLAVQSLRAGECDLAVAGGATVMSTPGMFLEFSRQKGLSADGRCKAFDESADGTGWSEGVGTLLVERLCDARRNGHPVLAVVRGTAVNQDGASNGLTAPNGRSQARLIRTALDNAQLTPADVDAVEAHGTGTRLGDPIEAQALLATYGQNRTTPLHLGSVKTNIGHTQAAAGIAGVIKMVLALRHGVLPRTLHVTRPTSHVDWSSGAIELLTRSRTWPQVARPRRAAVSAFGISGTNAHVILEQPEEPEEPQQPAAEDTPSDLPLLLSAASAEALAAAGKRLADHLEQTPGLPLPAVAHTLATTRALLPHRAAVLTDDHATALDGLRALADNRPAPHLITATATLAGPGPVFVFPGQGSQWAGMARTLHTDHPIFRQALDDCAAALDPLTGWSLTDTLTGSDHSWLHQVDKVQPALFAVMTSLARLWIAHGIQPGAVIGHSQGEIAAAHLAGILTLQDAARIVHTRSTAMRHLSGHGGMATINTSAEQLQHQLHGLDATIAAHNSPTTTVISGTPQALDELTTRCESDGLHLRRIHVDYASHSPQVDAYEDEITTALAGIRPRPATTPMISTVTGEPVQGPELDAAYWYANLRRPVLFHQALTHLTGSGHHTTIETSPHPVLTPAIQETADLTTLHTLRRDHGTTTDFTTALAAAHVTGTTPTWTTQAPDRPVPLPTYPFQHQRYWLEASAVSTRVSVPAGPSAVAVPHTRDRFCAASRDDLLDELLALVRVHAAVALGHDSPEPIAADRTFQELGFESLTAVNLRRRLVAETGLELPVSVAFDHPTPAALAEHLAGLLTEDQPAQTQTQARVGVRAGGDGAAEDLSDATDDELFALIDADGSDSADGAKGPEGTR